MSEKTKRELFVERGQEVIQLAWEIGGTYDVSDNLEAQERIRNGLYAIAIVEIMARPAEQTRFGSLISLYDVMSGDSESF